MPDPRAAGTRRLPAWLLPLPDASQQRAIDEWAIARCGIPSLALMERAGAGLAALVQARAPAGRVVVVAGKGNNGGDGLVAARLLRAARREVDVLLLDDPDLLAGDARVNLRRLSGAPPRPFEPAALAGASVIVDAILGTGAAGAPRPPAAEAIQAVADAAGAGAASPLVIACDIPSGVDASSGEVAGAAVRATATATFHAPKPGLWIAPGKRCAGEVQVVDIGIPAGAPVAPAIGLIEPRVLAELPRRGPDSNKFTAGTVLVCGGSAGLTGAPCLAAMAAMRAGAGYVTALVPRSLSAVFEQRLLEVMTLGLPDRDGVLAADAAPVVIERCARAGALVLGPGLGRDQAAAELARAVAAQAPVALVLDADGLGAHAGRLESLATRPAPTVLTPHEGELARLLELPSSEVSAHRLALARRAALRARAVVVLKGDDTLVAAPGGDRAGDQLVAVSRGGSPALATAGTGDVLAGVIGALLAAGAPPFTAACAGVLIHARAGALAAQRVGVDGVIASDVISLLARARAEGGT
ncbi:MAG TPA: NAD(P)H-hydrate dehydratase [Solirubrobacteraceae bacterium]|nr:NAD(P)H-hydrate dehydratase [Solirubrobacteraceae bacterium]